MYARFFRWASDRLTKMEFSLSSLTAASSTANLRWLSQSRVATSSTNYVVDLGGDVRADPKLSGTKHNVFGFRPAWRSAFMVKRAQGCKAAASSMRAGPSWKPAEEKLAFLGKRRWHLGSEFEDDSSHDGKHNWINLTQIMILIAYFQLPTKQARKPAKIWIRSRYSSSYFRLVSSTNRDEWVYDSDLDTSYEDEGFLSSIDRYNDTVTVVPRQKGWRIYVELNQVVTKPEETRLCPTSGAFR